MSSLDPKIQSDIRNFVAAEVTSCLIAARHSRGWSLRQAAKFGKFRSVSEVKKLEKTGRIPASKFLDYLSCCGLQASEVGIFLLNLQVEVYRLKTGERRYLQD